MRKFTGRKKSSASRSDATKGGLKSAMKSARKASAKPAIKSAAKGGTKRATGMKRAGAARGWASAEVVIGRGQRPPQANLEVQDDRGGARRPVVRHDTAERHTVRHRELADVAPERVVKRSAVRQAFLERGVDLVAKLADGAPEDVLAAALSKSSPMDTVATAMTAFVTEGRALDERERALAAARARGARHMQALLERAGGAYTADQLAEVLGKTGGRQTIAGGRKTHLYFGLPLATGAFAYPKVQVTPQGELLPGLREFLAAFTLPDPWMQLAILLEPSPRLGGRSPLDALRDGDVERAAAVAAAYGGHGA